MWTVAGAFDGQFNLAAGMATTGSLTRWFRDEFAKDLPEDQAYQALFEEAEAISPGAEGLLLLPYFSGERTPINDPKARGVIAGLSLAHKRPHIFRAILEGVAFGIRHNIDTFNEIGAGVKRVIAVGGGTKSRNWLEIVSSVAGVSQIVPELTIGASYGDAFLAGLAAGILKFDDISSWVKHKEVIHPDETSNQLYESIYGDYIKLYIQNQELLHNLADQSHH
jgi:xylulokinase